MLHTDVYKILCAKIMHPERNEYCGLCLNKLGEDAIHVNEEVNLQCSGEEYSEPLLVLLQYVLGEKHTEIMEMFEQICSSCLRLTISSYKFTKTCKDVASYLSNAAEDLKNGLGTTEDLTQIESLYVNINPHDCTIQQFYDNKRLKNPKALGLQRFCFIAHGTSSMTAKIKSERRRAKDFSTIFIKTQELMADPDKKDEFKCKMCLKTYPTSGCLRQHFFFHHFKKEFACPQCPKSFGTLGILHTHMSMCHETVDCAECGKKLKNRKSTIKRHQMMHNSGKKVCYRCGRTYKKINVFNKHMAQDSCTVPSKVKGDYVCDHCGYHCGFKHQLIAHIKYEHTGAQGFTCKWCGKKCYSQSALKTHILKHTKEKNYTCTECNGRFVTKQSLLNHTRLHTGERPYKCDHCELSFLSASRRRDHIERHHVSQTYDCDLCDAKYNARRSLVHHKRRHLQNGDQPMPEKIELITEQIPVGYSVIIDGVEEVVVSS